MKRILTLLLILLLSLGLAAPALADDTDAAPEATPEPFDTQPGAISQPELDWFGRAFFNAPSIYPVPMAAQFLTCLYEKPEDLDLHQVFYNGCSAIAPEEYAALEGMDGYAAELDTVKASAADMEDILNTYAGVGLDQLPADALAPFFHLDAYDAYYLCHSDTNAPGARRMLAGVREEDGTVRLDYLWDFDAPETDGGAPVLHIRQVTLVPAGTGYEGYHFVSNLEADSAPYQDMPLEQLLPAPAADTSAIPASGYTGWDVVCPGAYRYYLLDGTPAIGWYRLRSFIDGDVHWIYFGEDGVAVIDTVVDGWQLDGNGLRLPK